MRAGSEVVGMRADGDLHNRVGVVEPRRVRPVTRLAEAVLAVADGEGLSVAGEDDHRLLPVALVRLPEQVAGGVRVRVDVVVVEEPVLENRLAVLVDDVAVDGWPADALARRAGIAAQSADRRGGGAGSLVQPPGSRVGEVPRGGVLLDDVPRAGRLLLESGVGDERLDL